MVNYHQFVEIHKSYARPCGKFSLQDQFKMASKRTKSCEDVPVKPKRQRTLDNFFYPESSSSSTCQPRFVPSDPQARGIHIYSAEEIAKAAGMKKDCRLFWNSEAMKVCSSEHAITRLASNQEIEGAINTSWTLHKTRLLQLKVEELYVKASQIFQDETERAHSLSTVNANWEKLREITEEYQLIKNSSDSDEVSAYMRRLKTIQGALKKALDRRFKQYDQEKYSAISRVTAEEQYLPQSEIDTMASFISTEEQRGFEDVQN